MSSPCIFDEWSQRCRNANERVQEAHESMLSEVLVLEGEATRAVAYYLAGVACEFCSGFGRKSYGSTATWMGGVGGMAITECVCDECWGTGRNDRKGADLRKLMEEISEEGDGEQ